MHIAQCTVDQR